MNKNLPKCAVAAACGLMGMASSRAAVAVLDFEGLMDGEPVGEYYNGGNGDYGSGPGPNHGVRFSSNALALIDAESGGTGNFGGEPSPSTVMFFLGGQAATLTYATGFTSLSFFYSSPDGSGLVSIYDGPSGSGNLLAMFEIPITPNDGAPDPTGRFSPLLPINLNFQGVARSVELGGSANFIVFDDIALGTPVTAIPETGNAVALGTLLASGLLLRSRRAKRPS